MPRFFSNLFTDSALSPEPVRAFQDQDIRAFSILTTSASEECTSLTLKVGRKPRDLYAHVRRIYLCYQNAFNEALYGALLDLLLILDGKGRDLSSRLIAGSRSKLTNEQVRALYSLSRNRVPVSGVRYSLFSKGFIGTPLLVQPTQHTPRPETDWLALAEDFIHYSQLDEAMTTLEHGLGQTPGRHDLQQVLLELYKATDSRERFWKQYDQIRQSGESAVSQWQALAALFKESE